MRKIFTLAALALTSMIFAQEEVTKTETGGRHSFSVNGTFSDPSQAGISYEYSRKSDEKYKTSNVVNLSYGIMNYEVDNSNFDIDGYGFVIELGSRTYFNKVKHAGVYYSNYLSYGNIKFDENIDGENFDGTYSYFSFFSPEVGYKIDLNGFTIDPFIGIMWKLEIKGKGDIDNKNVDEWAPRAGLKIGYRF
ncbi:MAG: hypothetical protein EOO43_21500 [Flavobacterium sp.]|nr:MAG: hypothetical protein EOO43_21500 [Flavobacterium sp.]